MLRVLAAYADGAAIGFAPIRGEYENPLAASSLEERAARDDNRLFWLPQFEVDVVGLARADIFGALTLEDKVTTELAFAHLGINLANLELILLVASRKSGSKPLTDAIDIVLIDLCLYLIIREVIELAYLLSRLDALAQFHIEQSQFAVDGRADFELVLALANQHHILTHILQVILHLVHLNGAIDRVLLQTLGNQLPLLGRELIVLLRLDVILLADEFLLIEPLVLLIVALFALGVHIELRLLRLVVQTVLLHRHLGIAQQVLLLGEFGLGIQDLKVEVAV